MRTGTESRNTPYGCCAVVGVVAAVVFMFTFVGRHEEDYTPPVAPATSPPAQTVAPTVEVPVASEPGHETVADLENMKRYALAMSEACNAMADRQEPVKNLLDQYTTGQRDHDYEEWKRDFGAALADCEEPARRLEELSDPPKGLLRVNEELHESGREVRAVISASRKAMETESRKDWDAAIEHQRKCQALATDAGLRWVEYQEKFVRSH